MSRFAFIASILALATTVQAQRVHTLMPSPATVAFGYYDAAAVPVLRVQSGDEVIVGTLITSSPTRLEQAGIKPGDVQPSLRTIYDSVKNRGPGGHILTGPIFVEGADSGDVLEVRIESIDLAIPYAYNGFGPGRGFLPEDYTYGKTKIIPLDKEHMVAHFAPNIDVPLHPFFGSIGVAPPPSMGRVSSAPPGIHAGNLDNKELVAGTTLYIPVWTKGALLEIGDGHAGQGNGEVDITAMETSLTGRFKLVVRKDLHLTMPRAETPTHWIAMGIDSNLVAATKHMLTSIACDVDITELVDGTLGVHVMIPKRIFR